MRLLYLFILIIVCLQANSQTECNQNSTGLPLVLCSDIPTSINVCEQTQIVTFYIENSTTHEAQSIEGSVQLPLGIEYVGGTISGAGALEADISNLSAPTFNFSNIGSGNQVQFTVEVTVNCEIFDNTPGTLYDFDLSLEYIINSIISSSVHTTDAISIFEATLSIPASSITNQVYSGLTGDVFTRCITIENNGLGYVKDFQFTETHGKDIAITNVDLNNIGFQSSTSLILNFGSTQISNIGDGDDLFENGESITFCQDIRIDDCKEVSSLYQTSWGCDGLDCQEKKGGGGNSANVTFPNIIPNISHTIGNTISPQCIDVPMEQFFVLKNDGVGEATNLIVDVASGVIGGSVTHAFLHYYDTSTIQVQLNGINQPFTLDSIVTTHIVGNGECGATERIMGFRLKLPNIPSGDSLNITFDLEYCDHTACGTKVYNGWGFKLDYESICGDKYAIQQQNRGASQITYRASPNSPITSFVDGEIKQIDYTVDVFRFVRFPNNNRSKWIIEIEKNSCFNIVGGVSVYNEDSVNIWSTNQIQENDSVITATFTGPKPTFGLDLYTLSFNLEGNCSNCPTVAIDSSSFPECSRFGGVSVSGTGIQSTIDIGLNIYFVPDTACNTVMNLNCNDGLRARMTSCNSGCDSGLVIRSSSFERITLGQPDIDEDGQPDNNGKANHPEVRLNRVILGDKVRNTVLSVMNFPSGSQWDLCYVRTTFSDDVDFIDYISDTIIIKSSGNEYKISGVTPQLTLNGSAGTYLFDLTATKLIANGDLPVGFRYKHNDTIIYNGYYKIVKNDHPTFATGSNFFLQGSTSMHVNDSIEPTRTVIDLHVITLFLIWMYMLLGIE